MRRRFRSSAQPYPAFESQTLSQVYYAMGDGGSVSNLALGGGVYFGLPGAGLPCVILPNPITDISAPLVLGGC